MIYYLGVSLSLLELEHAVIRGNMQGSLNKKFIGSLLLPKFNNADGRSGKLFLYNYYYYYSILLSILFCSSIYWIEYIPFLALLYSIRGQEYRYSFELLPLLGNEIKPQFASIY